MLYAQVITPGYLVVISGAGKTLEYHTDERGRIGSVNRRHLSFMGSITAPGRLIRQSAPDAARWLVEDAVDIALLVPV